MAYTLEKSQALRKGLYCSNCKTTYPISPRDYCEPCFAPLAPVYKPFPYEIKREIISLGPRNIFRYAPLLPISIPAQPNVGDGIGLTPLIRADDLGETLGFKNGKLYVKLDEGAITGTFKDRGAFVVAQLVSEFNNGGYGFKALGGTSTGNLASAIAASASSINLESVILVHEGAEESLIKKTLSFGGHVLRVMADYSKVNDICKKIVSYDENLTSRIAWTNLTLRPLYSQGAKTIGFEIAEQLGWKAPENIISPAASGLSFWQIYEGLKELSEFGLITGIETRMHAAQPANCSTIVDAWRRGQPFRVQLVKNPRSLAETLCVGNPSNGYEALMTIKTSGGSAIDVSEADIENGMNLAKKIHGINVGPVGATVVAATKKLMAEGTIKPDESTVLVFTDCGNKEVSGGKEGKLIDLEPALNTIKNKIEEILAY